MTAVTGAAVAPSATRIGDDIRALAGAGNRFAGQPGDEVAARYVRSVLGDQLGLTIETTPVEVRSWAERHCRLILADGRELAAVAPFFGVGTIEPIVADVVLVSGEDALADTDVAGRIVALRSSLGYGLFWLGGLAARLAERGARGLLILHPMPWAYRPSMESGQGEPVERFAAPELPTAVLGSREGFDLAYALGAGQVAVTLDIGVDAFPCQSDCIAGVQNGAISPEERIIVLAHRDAVCAPGANDNGSGTAAMLEVARLLRGMRSARSLVFLSSAAEESAAPGAQGYIEALGERIGEVKAVISLDMIGVGGPLNVVESAHWPDLGPLPHSAWLNDLLVDSADALGYRLGRMQGDWGAAESGRFLTAGVPAAWLWKPDDPCYHTERDMPDRVDLNAVRVAAEIVAHAVRRLADEPHPSRGQP